MIMSSDSTSETEYPEIPECILPMKGDCKRKQDRLLARELQAQKVVEKKLSRKAAACHKKMYRPGECMQFMQLEVHPTLAEAWYMSDLEREIRATNAKLVSVADHIHPALVTWSRTVSQMLDFKVKNGLTPSKERCNMSLYVCRAEEFAELVKTCSLTCRITQMKDLASTPLSLVVFGLREYFKSSKENRKSMSEMELQTAIIDVLVTTGCDTIKVETPNDLALLLVQFTKAIAETPYKKAKRDIDNQVSFYMRGDNRSCIAVNSNGEGVSRLWQQMLAILPCSSLEVARALTDKYKSPLELYEGLNKPGGVAELADIGVSRSAVPGSKSRRIGPEFARKLELLFTSADGDAVLD